MFLEIVATRTVLLSCSHELPHPSKCEGEKLACRLCRPKRVYRSKLNEHTLSPLREVLEVFYV